MNKIIVTEYKNKLLVASFIDDKMIDLGFFDIEKDAIGTVFLCRINSVLDNIGACFINYKKDKKGFLKCSDYKCEAIIPLQLKSHASGNKEPVFTEVIELHSDFFVIKPGNGRVNISSKINDVNKGKLNDLFSDFAHANSIDIIVRTKAQDTNPDDLLDDLKSLFEKLCDINNKALNRTLYSILYKPEDEYISFIKEINKNNDFKIITDVQNVNNSLENVEFYNDEFITLSRLNKLEHHIESATKRRVFLKSGAEIVIDRTEAMTVIDINTKHYIKGSSSEDTFLKINLEACEEIMNQLRLRNISGMVIIDFINMKSNDSYSELLNYIKEKAKNDILKINNISLTGLKLVELTRQKIRIPVADQLR